MTKQLTVLIDGERVLDIPVLDAVLEINHPWEEIRSNPAMAAALAGAPPAVVAKLPGEERALVHHGSEILLKYTFRATADNAAMTEFRPVIG